MIRFSCNNCEKKLKVPYEYVSKKVKCPACDTALVVPQPPAPEQPADEANIFSDLKSDLEMMESQGAADYEQNEIMRESRNQNKEQDIDDSQWHDAPKKKKPKKESNGELKSDMAKLPLAIILGSVGAAIGAGVWALIAIVTFFILGSISGLAVIAIGFVTATGVVISGHTTGLRLAIISALITVCGILGGKFIMVNVFVDTVAASGKHYIQKISPKDIHDEIAQDNTILGMAAVHDLFLEGEVDKVMKDSYQEEYMDGDVTEASVEIQELHTIAMEKGMAWDRPTRYQKVLAWNKSLYDSVGDDVKKSFFKYFSIFEIVGAIFAVALAFRIGMGYYSQC